MKNLQFLWGDLPGSAEEQAWLESRFAEPSVQDYYEALAAAAYGKPQSMAELINLSAQLYRFEVYYGMDTPEKLGRYIATERAHTKNDLLPFLDLRGIGEAYAQNKGGVFIENGYAEPGYAIRQLYNGSNLAQLPKNGWAVRMKLASQFCPEGVWIDFPSVDPITGQDSPAMVLGELGVRRLSRCTLLDAQCRFANIVELVEQYDSVEELYRACQDFGYIWEEQGHGSDFFEERWLAAMELEQCDRLDFAMDIAINLNCYEFIPGESKLEDYGRKLVRRKGFFDGESLLAEYFDYKGYAMAKVEEQELEPCGNGFVKRNHRDFIREFSTEKLPELTLE